MENTATANNKMLELLKKRYGDKAAAPIQPQNNKAPNSDKKAYVRFKLAKALSALQLNITEEEKKILEDFLTREEIMEKSFKILLQPSGNHYLMPGLHSEEIQFKGEHGIFAILRPDQNGMNLLNLCYPALDKRLKLREFMPKLKIALEDWVIYLKDLQVQGTRVKHDLGDREIESDKEYLQKVSEQMMNSDIITTIADALISSAAYHEIYITPMMFGYDASGNSITTHLFYTDPEEYAKMMGGGTRATSRHDLLQGDVEIFELSLKSNETSELTEYRFAAIDPEKPSLYLHKGMKGYRPTLYIPEEIMQDFLNVTT